MFHSNNAHRNHSVRIANAQRHSELSEAGAKVHKCEGDKCWLAVSKGATLNLTVKTLLSNGLYQTTSTDFSSNALRQSTAGVTIVRDTSYKGKDYFYFTLDSKHFGKSDKFIFQIGEKKFVIERGTTAAGKKAESGTASSRTKESSPRFFDFLLPVAPVPTERKAAPERSTAGSGSLKLPPSNLKLFDKLQKELAVLRKELNSMKEEMRQANAERTLWKSRAMAAEKELELLKTRRASAGSTMKAKKPSLTASESVRNALLEGLCERLGYPPAIAPEPLKKLATLIHKSSPYKTHATGQQELEVRMKTNAKQGVLMIVLRKDPKGSALQWRVKEPDPKQAIKWKESWNKFDAEKWQDANVGGYQFSYNDGRPKIYHSTRQFSYKDLQAEKRMTTNLRKIRDGLKLYEDFFKALK